MNTSLQHLPQRKQDELKKITGIIVKTVTPEKVILFGSHARGTWVEDTHLEGHILHEYISDYDILVITQHGDSREEYELEDTIEGRCSAKQKWGRPDVNAIVHGIDHVNRMLEESQYFFSDIKKEGILLYDAGTAELADARELTNAEKAVIAQDDYDHWFNSAKGFLKGVYFYLSENELNIGAFNLHQATERTYAALILVFTGYKPRTHNLGKLYKMTKGFSANLPDIFPQNNRRERDLFKQLKNAYIDARYKKTYHITEPELTVLIERVKVLQQIAERICKQKIEELGKGE